MHKCLKVSLGGGAYLSLSNPLVRFSCHVVKNYSKYKSIQFGPSLVTNRFFAVSKVLNIRAETVTNLFLLCLRFMCQNGGCS